MQGKSIQADTVDDKIISIENLKTGIYIIKFKTNAGNVVQKFVKE